MSDSYFPGTLTHEQVDCLIRVFNNVAKAQHFYLSWKEKWQIMQAFEGALSWCHALMGVDHSMYRITEVDPASQYVPLRHEDILHQYLSTETANVHRPK